ncbi:MAG: DUF4115 domain-containing protein [Novosphingobium sp.]|jgi:transcriptional regulator with XRE-family HTH domain|nr:DUF4115 domain-containing protein [Novosphingobium sp.]
MERSATIGDQLRHAREAQGLSRADIAARTRIAERYLAALEEDRFADLASSTYAVGFSRAYARTVGLDERAIAQAVRSELAVVKEDRPRPAPTFEPGDPARVPSSRTARLAGIGVVVVIAALLATSGAYYFPAVSLPDLTSDRPAPPPEPKAATPAAVPAPPAEGPVTITATEAGIWVKLVDGSGKQLFQKQMALGESYTVPPDTVDPRLRTGRPDALAITIGGRPIPRLGDKPSVIAVPVSAAALLAPAAPAASTVSQ